MQLIKKLCIDYEIWEENEGFMIGSAIEINEYKYLLKAALNHSSQNSLVDVYILSKADNLEEGIKKLIKTLDLSISGIDQSLL
jgi:hypothetical protein